MSSRRSFVLWILLSVPIFGGLGCRSSLQQRAEPHGISIDEQTATSAYVGTELCWAGRICIVTLGDSSYTIMGACEATSASTILGCHVIATISITSITNARLVFLGLILVEWVIAWSVYYLPLPLKDPLMNVLVRGTYILGVGGVFIIQAWLYRSMTGAKGNLFQKDQVLNVMFITEVIVGVCIVSVAQLMQRWKNSPAKKG